MHAIITKYKTLKVTMEEASHGIDDCSKHGSGTAVLMDKLSIFFGLKVFMLLCSITEQLSCILQGREINFDDNFMVVNA